MITKIGKIEKYFCPRTFYYPAKGDKGGRPKVNRMVAVVDNNGNMFFSPSLQVELKEMLGKQYVEIPATEADSGAMGWAITTDNEWVISAEIGNKHKGEKMHSYLGTNLKPLKVWNAKFVPLPKYWTFLVAYNNREDR